MEIIAKGTLKVKMNSIDLVDSFFKNGTVESQKSLQINVPIIFPIDNFCNELTVHMRFCKAVHSWAYICKNNKCLSPNFIMWMKKLYSFKFKYVMTPEISEKFTDDFNTAHEFLLLVNNELIKAKKNRTIADFDELNEMIFNVVDVHQRLTALERMAGDNIFLSTVYYLEYYCCVCIHAHESLKKNGTFEEEILLEIEAQGMPCQKRKNMHKNPNQYRRTLSNYPQNSSSYPIQQERPKSEQFSRYETPIYNNDLNPYRKLNDEFSYFQPPNQQPQPNTQLQREKEQIQQLYTSHLQTSNQPIFKPPPQPDDDNDEGEDILSWSQYPSVTPRTFPSIKNQNCDPSTDKNELPNPPFAPPPYAPPPYILTQ